MNIKEQTKKILEERVRKIKTATAEALEMKRGNLVINYSDKNDIFACIRNFETPIEWVARIEIDTTHYQKQIKQIIDPFYKQFKD